MAADTPALLIYGDTERNAALRHELPLAIVDPLLFGIVDGRRHVMTNVIERAGIAAEAPDAELHDIAELGFHELLESGISPRRSPTTATTWSPEAPGRRRRTSATFAVF